MNNIPYQCDINCAGQFTLDALASTPPPPPPLVCTISHGPLSCWSIPCHARTHNNVVHSFRDQLLADVENKWYDGIQLLWHKYIALAIASDWWICQNGLRFLVWYKLAWKFAAISLCYSQSLIEMITKEWHITMLCFSNCPAELCGMSGILLWCSYCPMTLLPDTKTCGLRMHQECRERFPRHRLQRKPLVSDPGMHHDTCVTHVSWCMSVALTRGGGENVPGISGACPTRNFTYLARGPLHH